MSSFPVHPITVPMDDSASRASSSTPPTSPEVHTKSLKRKEHPDSEHEDSDQRRSRSPSNPDLDDKTEYENGVIVCDVCSESIPIRDDNGRFTKELWAQHRKTHAAPHTSSHPAAHSTSPDNANVSFVPPPTKRRRAKRTEEERIEYLKSDPYVEKYEAYRVLCKSCDKWIRLRPNSTYCSIPWDAHRKSCLAKKVNSKNVYALEERNAQLSKDPEVRKFDQERVLCNICDDWIAVDPEDHMKAVQTWAEHRNSCRRPGATPAAPASNAGENVSPTLSSASVQRRTAATAPSAAEPSSPKVLSLSSIQHQKARSPGSSSSFQELTPANYAPAHESRRRNAEQRAATLRADNLIGMVEPNRVFCSLCQKWVQLRQDSTYCAYPWLQHRGKCLARYQRRQQKAAEVAAIKAKRQPATQRHPVEDVTMLSEDEQSDAPGEYEDSPPIPRVKTESRDEPFVRHRMVQPPTSLTSRPSSSHRPRYHPYHPRKARSIDYSGPSNGHSVELARRPSTSHTYPYHRPHSPASSRSRMVDEDADDDADADGEVDEEAIVAAPPPPPPRPAPPPAPVRRSVPASLADLDSPIGRRNFIFASVKYLFATTYEATDDMSISTLLTYLNAAMPVDKHEDFDTSEVIKAVAALQDKGKIRFEGDMLRPILH